MRPALQLVKTKPGAHLVSSSFVMVRGDETLIMGECAINIDYTDTLDKDGNVVEEWTTDGNAHVLTAQLIAGETYTLHEKSAPAGYELAKDQTFTVPDDGENTVTMTAEKPPTTPPVATPTTPTPTSTATPKTTSTPKTGDATPVMAIGTGLLASFFIMLLTRRKKRRNRKAA